MKKILSVLCITVAMSALTASPSHADELSTIKERGTLVCGTLGTADPFSFLDPGTRETVGYDVDMCRAIADALKVKLQIKLISVDARVPELAQGRVDILAANLGYTKQRAEQIDYSDAYFVGPSKLLVRKDSGITTFEQLAGKRIAVVKGSSAEPNVRKMFPSASIISFPEPTSGFLAVVQGKADALCASELALIKMQKQAASATPLSIIANPVYVESWGLGIRKGEPAFRKTVNDALTDLERSGRATAIFNTWLGDGSPYKIRRSFTIEPIRD